MITGVGGTGVVGVLRNGAGRTVLLRADMDGLPVEEATGLDYASVARGIDPDGIDVPVMHACGHDVHVTCLLGAAELLLNSAAEWSGTLVVLFQPAEELGGGAQAMVDDGLYERIPPPDVVLGQHVTPAPAGILGAHSGPAFAGADSFLVRLFGRGGHGSQPESTVDPVVMAAANAPLVYWLMGGSDPQKVADATAAGTTARDIPSNHSPYFAPVVRPTLDTGIAALTIAAREWFKP